MTQFVTNIEDTSVLTPNCASSGNVANAAAVATMAAITGKTAWATGFIITAGGATAAAIVAATLTGLLGGTMTIPVAAQAGVALCNAPIVVSFPRAIPASAVNTALTLTLPALGAGNTNAAVSLFGYYA